MPHSGPYPVAIGGLGGSGTRVFAALLQLNGYYLGSDLNGALDNLWFTLLFKRRSVLFDSDERFHKLAQLFFSAMQGDRNPAMLEIDILRSLAMCGRVQHSKDWLSERVASLIRPPLTTIQGQHWGWKEPNTHILIPKLLELNDHLKYIHVLRDPFYMAESRNQNQLINWGPIFLDSDVEVTPQNSLSLWRKIHERIISLRDLWPDRILITCYEDLINRPACLVEKVSTFLDIPITLIVIKEIMRIIEEQPAVQGIRRPNISAFAVDDVKYVNDHWNSN